MVLVGKLRESKFLRQNAILFIGSLAVSFLNYLYYPVLGRLLGLEEYGEVQVLVSLFLQLTIFLTVLTQITVNIVANYKDVQQRDRVIFELEKLALWLGAVILILGTLFSGQLKGVFNFVSPLPFVILLVAVCVTVPLTFRLAYLRGQQKFTETSIAGALGSAGKVLMAVLLIVLGFGTAGAIGGLVAAQLVALLYAAMKARRAGLTKPQGARFTSKIELTVLKPELKYILFVFAASLGVTVLSSVDIMLVKMFFSAEVAGGYAGIATVAKIIFFLTASVAQALLPVVKVDQPKRHNRKLLLKSFLLLTAVGGVALILFTLLPVVVVGGLMGKNFLEYAYLLPPLSLAVFFVSVINLIVAYYIALRRYQVGAIVVAGVVLVIGLLTLNHATLTEVADQLALGSFLMLLLFVVWRGVNFMNERRRYA